jgi:hypothetical protein
MARAEAAVETHGLTKSFGEVRALGGIDLRVEPGVVFGLLEPNGDHAVEAGRGNGARRRLRRRTRRAACA